MRLGRLWIAAAILVPGVGCGDDGPDCIEPLPPTNYDTPWPSYSQKLTDFESCRDSTESLAGYSVVEDQSCADGKHVLVAGGGFGSISYYFRGETLVGRWEQGDAIIAYANGCDSNAPEGTHESLTCRVVSTREIDCVRKVASPPCGPGSARCDGDQLQMCSDDGSAWVLQQICVSPAFCDSEQQRCNAAPCGPGAARCNDSTREQCNADQTAFEAIETCVSADRCTPDACL
jgi:hypothetical protein